MISTLERDIHSAFMLDKIPLRVKYIERETARLVTPGKTAYSSIRFHSFKLAVSFIMLVDLPGGFLQVLLRYRFFGIDEVGPGDIF